MAGRPSAICTVSYAIYLNLSTGITMMLMLIIERNKQFVCDAHFCAETQSAESTTSHSSSFCINAEVYTATFEMLRLPTKFFFGLNQNQKPSHFTQRLSAPLISDIIPCVVFCILFVSRFPPRYWETCWSGANHIVYKYVHQCRYARSALHARAFAIQSFSYNVYV